MPPDASTHANMTSFLIPYKSEMLVLAVLNPHGKVMTATVCFEYLQMKEWSEYFQKHMVHLKGG